MSEFRDNEAFDFVAKDGYEICPMRNHVDLDIWYMDSNWGEECVTLDALEVYQTLKEYFKGADFE